MERDARIVRSMGVITKFYTITVTILFIIGLVVQHTTGGLHYIADVIYVGCGFGLMSIAASVLVPKRGLTGMLGYIIGGISCIPICIICMPIEFIIKKINKMIIR